MVNAKITQWESGFKMVKRFALVVALSLSLVPLARGEVPAPQLGEVRVKLPLPLPYDQNADAKAQVDAALAKAKASGKRLLIDLGGNWCADCRVFSGIIEAPEVHKWVDQHFEVVLVDVGRFNANLDIPARFGIQKLEAAPSILIVSPQGQLLNGGDIVALQDARSMTPQAVIDWLAKWAA